MFRFYHRTSADHGYSNGIFFEFLRGLWPVFIVLVFIGAFVGMIMLNPGATFLTVAMSLGAWWGWKHPKRR